MRATKRVSRLEIRFRTELWRRGLRYRLRLGLPGKPDLVFPAARLAVFVNGCFWHRCPTCDLSIPKANHDFWAAKLSRNVERDAEVREMLTQGGWDSLTVWECDISASIQRAADHVAAEVRKRGECKKAVPTSL
jgi:DNA mismatch endonuclease (patch repair protein)